MTERFGVIRADRVGRSAALSGLEGDGARRGAPQAVQVADRFHLLHNLAETLETVFTTHSAALRAVEPTDRPPAPDGAVQPAPPHRPATARTKAAERRERRLAQHQQVWALHREGWPGHAIAHHLGLGRSTVFRSLQYETFPERKERRDTGHSLLDPWKPILLDR